MFIAFSVPPLKVMVISTVNIHLLSATYYQCQLFSQQLEQNKYYQCQLYAQQLEQNK